MSPERRPTLSVLLKQIGKLFPHPDTDASAQQKRGTETPQPLTFREYLGLILPPEKGESREVVDSDEPVTFSEYLSALLPSRKKGR